MQIGTFRELFLSELQEARSAEAILLETLPKMAEAAESEDLRDAFRLHEAETRTHLERVEAVVKQVGGSPGEHEDHSMSALVREAEKMIGMTERGPVRDAALIASAQRIEHYEIALYGTLADFADTIGMEDHTQTLADILEEEKTTDEKLSAIADGLINPSAVESSAG